MQRAGLPLDPYFSASKLRWMIDHLPEAKPLLAKGKLRLGTSDSFFLDRLTGAYATDPTTASRSSLMNLETCQWDPELCRLFGVPMEALAEIRPTAGSFGACGRLPITASLVDQQAALFGHGCRRSGQAKITFGTGAFALAVSDRVVPTEAAAGMNRSIAWQFTGAPPAYALEAGIYNAASAVNWARGLGLFANFAEIDGFAGEPAIERGLVFVPALSGLAAPYWDRNAAGLWLGMGLETTKADMMQALLEGIALLAAELIGAMDRATPLGRRRLHRRRALQQRLFLRLPGRCAWPARRGAECCRPDRPRLRPDGHDRRRARHTREPAARAGATASRPAPPAGLRGGESPLCRSRPALPQLAMTQVPC